MDVSDLAADIAIILFPFDAPPSSARDSAEYTAWASYREEQLQKRTQWVTEAVVAAEADNRDPLTAAVAEAADRVRDAEAALRYLVVLGRHFAVGRRYSNKELGEAAGHNDSWARRAVGEDDVAAVRRLLDRSRVGVNPELAAMADLDAELAARELVDRARLLADLRQLPVVFQLDEGAQDRVVAYIHAKYGTPGSPDDKPEQE